MMQPCTEGKPEMRVRWWLCLGLLATSAVARPPEQLERSYWLHASLADLPQRGYWGPDFAPCQAPSTDEVRRAATLLSGAYGANRLYLLYHHELPVPAARELYLAWRAALPPGVELVPTVLLRMYDQPSTPTFTDGELRELLAFFRDGLRAQRVAWYDVYPHREQGSGLAALLAAGLRVVRVGLQPGEVWPSGAESAVEDTWSGLCTGREHRDWELEGAPVLRGWVRERADEPPVAWDLVVVAWDYSANAKGTSPGYDDANRNQPLPAGRNRLAAQTILATAAAGSLAGFSSDLCILQANSCVAARDGREGSFYRSLRRGERYGGYFHEPLDEVAALYDALRSGRLP